jgi:phosphatidylglycerol:prolipoprotein diacylglycerol transferase
MISFLYNFIVWNISPEIFTLGKFSLRWYGLLFALGFLIGQQILIKIYKQEGKTEKHVETLTIYMLIATILGARLGHCLFYQPEFYLKNPIEILKIWEGGLASHGAVVGILLAIYIYSRKQTDQSYLYVLDRLVITIALAGCLIRTGNLMNSEIYGKQTEIPFGFVFVSGLDRELQERYSDYLSEIKIRNTGNDTLVGNKKYAKLFLTIAPVDSSKNKSFKLFIDNELNDYLHYSANADLRENIFIPEGNLDYTISETPDQRLTAAIEILGVPRHPTQIYEALQAFLLFLLLYYTYNRYKEKTPEGRIFGLFVFILFTFRFLVEYYKTPQVDFENGLFLNMGQILSIPLIIAGLFVLMRSYKKPDEII